MTTRTFGSRVDVPLDLTAECRIRVVVRQTDAETRPVRSVEYSPENEERLGLPAAERGRAITFAATWDGHAIPVERAPETSDAIGISWAVGEFEAGPGRVVVSATTRAPDPVTLTLDAYLVDYAPPPPVE